MRAGLADAPPAARACLFTVTVDRLAWLAERLMASLSCFKLAA